MEPAAEPRVGAFEPMSEPMTRSPARAPLTLPRPEVSVPIPRSYSHQKVPCNLEPRLLALEQNVGRNADLCAKIEGFFERVTARVDALESNQLAKDILVDLQEKMRSIEQEWEKHDFVRIEKMTDTTDQEQEWTLSFRLKTGLPWVFTCLFIYEKVCFHWFFKSAGCVRKECVCFAPDLFVFARPRKAALAKHKEDWFCQTQTLEVGRRCHKFEWQSISTLLRYRNAGRVSFFPGSSDLSWACQELDETMKLGGRGCCMYDCL